VVMNRKLIPVLFSGLVVAVAAMAFGGVHYFESNYQSLPYYQNNGKLLIVPKSEAVPMPAFEFTGVSGHKIDQNFVKGKICVANYFFTTCGSICPRMNANLWLVQQAFLHNEAVRILSLTCDPGRDDVEKMKAYATMMKADTRQWEFLTGSKYELYRFARHGLHLTATEGNGGDDDFIHAQTFVLIDKQGFIRGYYDGLKTTAVNRLISDMKKL
jgi:protein SCO1/2